MKNKTNARRTPAPELPRDARAEEILEFVHNDEHEALCDEDVVLSYERDMPALREFLEHMHELDAPPGNPHRH